MIDALHEQLQPVYEICLTANPYLAVLALVALGYRAAPTMLVFDKPTAAARFMFGGYILLTALGSWENKRIDNEATYVSPLFTLLHLGVITLFRFWDFGLSRGIEDQARARGELRTRKDDL